MIHRKQFKKEQTDNSYWKSYSDMMAGLLLMFILIMTIALATVSEQAERLREHEEKYTKIIEKIDKELKQEFPDIKTENGVMKFEQEEIVFEEGESVLLDQSKRFLSDFFPRYLAIVLKEENRPYIESIIIEGHTNTNGTYMENLKLSQDRALAVANYCINDNSSVVAPSELTELRKLITANGRSFSELVYTNGKEDKYKSRRVEIKVKLSEEKRKDDYNKIK